MDRESLIRAYEACRPRLVAYLARLAGPSDAEDLAQAVWLKASGALEGFRGESAPQTWLFSIASNLAKDRLRERGRSPEAAQAQEEDAAACEGQPSCAESAAILREMRGCIRELVDKLPEADRQAVLLADVAELSGAEAAEVLGISRESARVRLHRARARLRDSMERH